MHCGIKKSPVDRRSLYGPHHELNPSTQSPQNSDPEKSPAEESQNKDERN